MPTVYTEVEVDVSLEDFDDEDLIDEMERRGLGAEVSNNSTASELIQEIYQKRRLGKDFETELDQLIYQVTGRAV
jgi:hypothetical protein